MGSQKLGFDSVRLQSQKTRRFFVVAEDDDEEPPRLPPTKRSRKIKIKIEDTKYGEAMSPAPYDLRAAGIQTSKHKHKRAPTDYLRHLIRERGRMGYKAQLPPLNLVMHDYDLTRDHDEQEA